MKRTLSVAHPWLFAVFPVLFLYARNLDEIGPSEIVIPLIVVLGSTAVLLATTNLLLRDLRRAGLVTSAVLLLFFSYGHVWDVFSGRVIGSIYIDKDVYLLLPWAAISVAVLTLAASARRSLREITSILNAVGLVLVFFPSLALATSGIGSSSRPNDCPPELRSSTAATTGPGRHPRDIYYLIFDRYAPSSTLLRRFNFDNTPFQNYLKSKGFYVAEQSHANYPRTSHSLASSLNANFLGCLSRKVGASSTSLRPLFSSIGDHAVGRFLTRLGYRYLHVGSWFSATARSPIADRNFVYEASRGFSSLLYTTSLARPFGEMLGLSDNRRVSDAKRALFQFRQLNAISTIPGPKLVFAHILLPHEPYLFTKTGRIMSAAEESSRSLALNYSEQLQFTNSKIHQVVDALTAGPPASHPVIVLQSDEGPHPIRFDLEGEDFDWSRATPDELSDTLHIFNAIYLPGQKDPGFFPMITPVNTFRRIFNLYLGANLPLLPDRSFIYKDERHPYDFLDVTDRLPAR